MKKSGQIATFVLIAIAIIIAGAVFIFFRTSLSLTQIVPSQIPSSETDPIYNAFFSCLKKVGDDATLVTLFQGGTYEKNDSYNFQIYKLAKPGYILKLSIILLKGSFIVIIT